MSNDAITRCEAAHHPIPAMVQHCRELLQGTRHDVIPSEFISRYADVCMALEEWVKFAKRSGYWANDYAKELAAESEGLLERNDSDGGTR